MLSRKTSLGERKSMRKLIVALGSALLAISCGTPSERPEEPLEGGEDVTLRVVDSIGVEMGDSNYVFGAIEAVDFGIDGNIYVLDRSASCVKVYTPDGDFIRQIAEKGSGPGEISNPLDMTVLGDGRVAVCAPYQNGIHTYSSEGEWLGLSAEFFNNPPMSMVGVDSNAFLGMKLTIDFSEGEPVTNFIVGRYEESNEPSVVYHEKSLPFDPQDLTGLLMNTFYSQMMTGDREGNVYIAPYSSEEYLVRALSREGEEILQITRNDIDPVRRTPEEIRAEKDYMEGWLRSIGASGVVIDFEPNPYRWMVSSLGVDGEGRIWVRRGTELLPFFDVYGPDGELLFTASVEGISDEGQFWVTHIDEHGFLAYSENPVDYQRIYVIRSVGTGEL
jgi:hypothetical protein